MKVAVYCGSSVSTNEAHTKVAKELGKWIGEHGHSLVYGGGEAGLMGVVSKAAHDAGSYVYGVVPGNVDFIKSRPQPYVDELITAADMSERKKTMLDISDAFVALPGGIGTLDEVSEAITLTRIGYFDKPCVFVNTDGFYEPVKALLRNMEGAGYVEDRNMRYVLFSDDVNEIASYIESYGK